MGRCPDPFKETSTDRSFLAFEAFDKVGKRAKIGRLYWTLAAWLALVLTLVRVSKLLGVRLAEWLA